VNVVRRFPAQPIQLSAIRDFVFTVAAANSFAECSDELSLAVNEACANAMIHTASRFVDVRLAVAGEVMEMDVSDGGVFGPRPAAPEPQGGQRGIALMTAMVDELTIHEGTADHPGTVVHMVKRRRATSAGATRRSDPS
jgi:anti-sigma regulatory factor (Ser/Thr protein kinase)